jgi:hypothetical protein
MWNRQVGKKPFARPLSLSSDRPRISVHVSAQKDHGFAGVASEGKIYRSFGRTGGFRVSVGFKRGRRADLRWAADCVGFVRIC